jgi:small subunit ribosomal protein S8
MIDPISDMLTRIRNAQAVGKDETIVPFSNLRMAIAKILEEKGYIEKFKKESEGKISNIRVSLKYEKISTNSKASAITGIKQVSKHGRRAYVGKKDIKKVKQGYGISIVSTSKGVMTGEDARKLGVGGEMLCEIW